VRKNDILICVRNGSRELIGKAAMIDHSAAGMTFGAFMSVFRTQYSKYVFFQLQSLLISKQIKANIGATINQITNANFNSFIVPLPPLAEQRAIAEVLSDMDAQIAALDALIAKKRDIKQGAMQELLTGRRRLPGFTGAWETRRLGEVAEIISGGTPNTSVAQYWDGEIWWCTPTDITATSGKYLTQTTRTISELGLRNSSAHLLPVGSILLCTRATIGELRLASIQVATNQGFKSLLCNDLVSNDFLYYLISTKKPKMLELAIGSTFLEISKRDVEALEIVLPSVSEQTAIAGVLSDMDNEITALEAQRRKTADLKQAMMQELLTGKTRLI